MYRKNAKNKIIFTTVALGSLLIASAYFTSQQAYAACATYDSANNRIIVSCNTTLPQVASEINNPSIIEDKGNGEYIIRATLQTSHSKLTISSADGVSWLKFTADSGLYFYYANGAISGVKITSWDESTNSPIDNKGAAARTWVRFYKTTDATIQNSEFAYLGHGTDASSKRGISFEGSGSTNVHIDNSEFHHNHYAFYSNGLSNSDIKNSEFHDDDKYDIDPHTGTNNMIIANNHIHDSQAAIGIICSLNCYSITIEGNTVEDSPSSAITLSRNMHDSIVRNNELFNAPTAISVTESPNNEIYGNTIHDISRGIYLQNPSVQDDGTTQNNLVHDNTISKAAYGILASASPENTAKNNNIDSATVSYEYYLTSDSKLIIDSQKFNSDKVMGVSGNNQVEIRNSGFISVDGGAPTDTDTSPYSATLTSKIITVNSASGPAPAPDTTKPTVKITEPANNANVPLGTLTVKGTSADNDGGSGIKTVQVRVDSGSYITAIPAAEGDFSTWSVQVDIATEGQHRILARATDNSGNQGFNSIYVNGVTANTTLDTTKPTVKITSPKTGDSLSGNSTIHVTGTASDDTGGSGLKTVQVHVDSGPYQAVTPNAPGDWSTWSIDLSITNPGTHKIQARATDNAGNQNWSTISVSIT